MKINAGVLIIGSLFWDINQGDNINLRKNWRRDRLIMNERIHVKAPIRYGRISGNGSNQQYTMIFSKSCDNKNTYGTAYVIPFKRRPIKSIKGLENQARFLSEAEGANDKKLCKGEREWCTIGLLFNRKLESGIKNKILNKWKGLLSKDGCLQDTHNYKIGDEKSILSNDGEILINWPKAIDDNKQKKIDEFDIIIATCTKPNLTGYPSIDDLKMAANNDKRKYFYQNIKHGITTFQDRSILK